MIFFNGYIYYIKRRGFLQRFKCHKNSRLWCGRRDSNPHTTKVMEPKSIESTNSTTPAHMTAEL